MSLSCKPPLILAILSSIFTSRLSNPVYCPLKYSKFQESPFDDFTVNSQVFSLCLGPQDGSFLDAPVILSKMSGVKVIKPSTACNKNYSAMRTTLNVLIRKLIRLEQYDPYFLYKQSTSTPSKTSLRIRLQNSQSDDSFTNKSSHLQLF